MTVPSSRVIVIRVDGGDPRATFRHELAHLVLHDAVRGRVPLWFSEGYAVVAAAEWGRLQALRLNLAVARGRIPGLRSLDAALRDAPATAEAAYALAGSAVLYLARVHPDGTLDPLIGRLMAGEPFADALLASTGRTVDRFDDDWRKDVKRRYGLLVWLAAGGFWAVVGGLVLVLRGWRRRADRPRRAALDIGWPLPPEGDETVTLPELDRGGGGE